VKYKDRKKRFKSEKDKNDPWISLDGRILIPKNERTTIPIITIKRRLGIQ
jgi:hypothetical protein